MLVLYGIISLVTGIGFVQAGTVSWTGRGSNNLWQNPANWSGGFEPGSEDDVIIPAGEFNVVFGNGDRRVRSLQCESRLTIEESRLTLLGDASRVSGALYLKGGKLSVEGAGAALSANGTTILEGTDLEVLDGGEMILTGVTLVQQTNPSYLTLAADGEGSLLSLPNMTGGSISPGYELQIRAGEGGQVLLPKMTRWQGGLDILASGTSSRVDLSGWTGQLGGVTDNWSYLEAAEEGAILIPNVTTLERVQLTLRGESQTPVSQLTAVRQGAIKLFNTSRILPNLSDVSGTDLVLQEGAQLTLTAVTQLVQTNSGYWNLEAYGEGSVLSLPNVTGGSTRAGYELQIRAHEGGRILLPKMTRWQGGLDILAAGTGSSIDLSGWTGQLGGATDNWSYLEARDEGAILIPKVTMLERVQLTLKGESQTPVNQLTAIRQGAIKFFNTTRILPNLSDVSGTDLMMQDGAQLTLATVTQLVQTNNGYWNLEAYGEGSILSLPNVTGGSTRAGYELQIRAGEGGQILLPKMTRWQGGLDILASEAGSQVDLSGWTGQLGGATDSWSYLEAREEGAILIPKVATLERVHLTLRGESQTPVNQLTAVRQGAIKLFNTSRILPNLSDVSGTDLVLQEGAQLTLTAVTQLVQTNSGYWNLEAYGEGSVLSLPNVTGGSIKPGYELQMRAREGGRILLPKMTRWQGGLDILAAEAASQVDLSGWTGQLGGATDNWSYLEAAEKGAILIPKVTALDRVGLILDQTGIIPTTQLVAITRSAVTIDGGTINFAALADTTGTTFKYLNNGSAAFPTPVDLEITKIEAPATAVASQYLPIVWEITNRGIGLTNGVWSDALFLSADSKAGDDILIGSFPASGSLPRGAVLRITNQVRFPVEQKGPRYLVVAANQSRTVFEGTNYGNNTNISAVPLMIQAPELILESVSVQPAAAQLGQSITVAWSVRNTGDAAATGEWVDRWWLSPDPSSLAHAINLFSQPITAGLLAGAHYSRTITAPLPLSDNLSAGVYYVVGETDQNNVIKEFNESNNTNSARLTLILPPLPDLAVSELHPPAEVRPGGALDLRWSVTNQGTAAARGVWSEAVFLTATNQGAAPMRLWVSSFTNDLQVAAILTRTQRIELPEELMAGSYRLSMEVNQNRTLREGNTSNNLFTAPGLIQIPAILSVRISAAQVPENISPPVVAALVTRNGDLSLPLSVSLNHGADPLLTTPLQVTLEAGESSAPFALTVHPDGVPSDDHVVPITATATGYQSGTAFLRVQNTDRARLQLQLGAASVMEGKTVAATISHDDPRKPAVEVSFSSPNAARLLFPEKISIPAGVTSTTFVLLAADNSQVDPPIPCLLQASSTGFFSASAGLSVLDDDLPVFSLILSSSTVSEGDGLNATVATLSRGTSTPRSLSAVLSNSHPTVAATPARVVIPAGQASISFPIAVFDNSVMDGPKTSTLQAFAQATSSETLVASSPPVTLTVLDDDGPALKVTASRDLLGEGVTDAASLTVGRNTPANLPLRVNLSSSDPSRLSVPASITIPPGQPNVILPLSTLPSPGDDGNRTVRITASAPNFVSASINLTITDLTRPDLIVSEVVVPEKAETEGFVNISYRILNQGMAPARSNWVTRIFLSNDAAAGDDTLLTEYAFNGTLPVGEYFGQSRQVRLPQVPGNYWFVVVTDTADQILEALENNNTTLSARPIRVEAAYRARVETEFEKGPAGSMVPLHGIVTKTSTGGPEPFALANIHIYVRGTQRILSVLADEFGRFTATFTPLAGEAGLYEIGAAHPGQTDAAIQDSFTLFGLKAEAVPPLKMTERSTLTGQVTVENLGDLPLSGVSVTVVSNTTQAQITASVETPTLSGLQTMKVGFALAAGDGALAQGSAVLRVSSLEGARVDVPLQVSIESLAPRLTVHPQELRAGMKVGGQALVTFDVSNEGGSPSQPIQVVLPDFPWLHLATANPLPALQPGAAQQVVLQLTPAASLALGSYEGTIVILGGSRELHVPFNFRALSEAKGDLRVTVEDEYTYYAEGAPRVSGASITVRDAVSEQVIAQGLTDAAGSFRAPQLPEGYYAIQVKSENHSSYDQIHLVIAGFETNVVALISRESVRLIWTVTPTEIQDRTKITIESVFEAFVPMPVVTVDPEVIDLSEYSADVTQIELRITNHGLVAAQKAELSFGTHPDWSFHPLLDDLGDLPARSTLVVPLLIRRTANGAGPRIAPMSSMERKSGGGGGGCSVGASLKWELPCAVSALVGSRVIAIINAKSSGCGGGSAGGSPGGGGGGGGSPGGGGGGLGGVSGEGPDSCDPCMLAILKCLVDFVMPDVGSCIKNSATCAQKASQGASWEAAGECAKAILACLEAAGKEGLGPVNKALDALECIQNLKEGCGTPSGGGGGGGGAGGNGGQQKNLPATRLTALAPSISGTSTVERAALAVLFQRGDWMAREIAPVRYLFGNDAWFAELSPALTLNWLRQFNQFTESTSTEGLRLSSSEVVQLKTLPLPESISASTAQAFIDRWNRSIDYWKAGVFYLNQIPAGQNRDFLALDTLDTLLAQAMEAQETYRAAGFSSADEAYRKSYDDLFRFLSEGDSTGVCAHVRIRIEQELVSTRDAFDARLEIENAILDPLENISVELMIRKSNGEDALGLFAIFPPDLTGITAVDGTGLINGRSSGKIHWLLVPTTEAAVNGPEEYLVAGMLRYRQGQLNVTAPLPPVKITVYPSPSLKVKYFHQRDVLADDPFTVEVEPSVPFSLAVMVENKGHGAARDVRISSAQPKIVENDKGLFVDFKIIATEVSGHNLEPSLTVDFGQIDPGTNAIGRWLLTSTLLGGFIEYSATFEHLNGLGQKKLSLVEGVEIHELNHIVNAPGLHADGRPDFLVNDVADLYSRPDTIHLSNGSVEPVSMVEVANFQGEPSPSHREVGLTASLPAGWAYLKIPNPWGNTFRLERVVRSDGVEIALGNNVWTTDRTFLGNARQPIPEHNLHLFDWNSTGRYTLYFAELPGADGTLPSSHVTALPAESTALIPVCWDGEDNAGGSGLSYFDVYVSIDGADFTLWQMETIDRSAQYQGAMGKTYAFYSVATDRAGNREEPPSIPDAHTRVTRVNRAPTLDPIPDQVIREGQILTLHPVARDPDGDSLIFSLESMMPGIYIEPYTGTIYWSTGPGSGPSVTPVLVRVLDNGLPRMGAERTFSVTVGDVNTPPVVDFIEDQRIEEEQKLVLACRAQDGDIPLQTLTYSFVGNAPAGATLDSKTGIFTWQPTVFQGGSTNRITIQVTDNGSPPLSAKRSFTIVVLDTQSDFSVNLGLTNVLAGQGNWLELALDAAPDLVQIDFELEASDPHLENLSLKPAGIEVASAVLNSNGNGRFRGHIELDPALTRSGERGVAWIQFATRLQGKSSVAAFRIESLSGIRSGGQPLLNARAHPGRLFIIENEPLIDAIASSTTQTAGVVIYGKPDILYRLQSSSLLGPNALWSTVQGTRFTSTYRVLYPRIGPDRAIFFRVLSD